MGLCTSKSTINLNPSANLLSMEQASRTTSEGLSPDRSPILDEGILMVQPVKLKNEGTGARGGGTKTSINQTVKGYLEVVGGGCDGEAQTSKEVDEEEEDEEGNMVEELINISDSKDSLRSEFLEWRKEKDEELKRRWKDGKLKKLDTFLTVFLMLLMY